MSVCLTGVCCFVCMRDVIALTQLKNFVSFCETFLKSGNIYRKHCVVVVFVVAAAVTIAAAVVVLFLFNNITSLNRASNKQEEETKKLFMLNIHRK